MGIDIRKIADDYKQQYERNDRIILADIAKNGLEGINNQYYANSKDLDSVMERYKLNDIYEELGKNIDLLHGGEPEIYRANQEIPKLENKLKEDAGKALKELDKGYIDALNKLKAELLQKQAKYPNNPQIERDLNIVASEISKVGVKPGLEVQDINEQKSKSVKLNVHDPDTYEDAKRDKEQEEAIGQEQERSASTGRKI